MVEKLIEIIRSEWGKTIFMACQRAFAEHLIAKDVVPVVRCKDCRRAENHGADHEVFCNLICAYMGNNDFCSCGERKEA